MKILQITRLALFSAVLAAGQGICTAANLVLNVPTASDYVTVPDADSLDLVSTSFTLEAWINAATFAQLPPDGAIIAKRRLDGGTSYHLSVSKFGGDTTLQKAKVVLGMNNGGTGSPDDINYGLFTSQELNTNVWYHVAGTYSREANETRLYIDGQLKAAETFILPRPLENSSFPVTIGQMNLTAEPRNFLGQIDEVRIWNIALTAEQILAGLNRKLTGHEPHLVGYWNFDSGSPVDSTSFRNNGALIGEARIVAGPAIFDERERPVFTAGRFSPVGGFRFLFETMNAGSAFQIEASTDLANWSPVGFTINLQQPGSVELTDPTATNFTSLRFYRARSTQ